MKFLRDDETGGAPWLALLGQDQAAEAVQAALRAWLGGAQPALDPDDEYARADWLGARERGVQLGFTDRGYALGETREPPYQGPMILTQIQLFAAGDAARAQRIELPFGVRWGDGRAAVRAKLASLEPSRRSHLRDAWQLGAFDWIASYDERDQLTAFAAELPLQPWPPLGDERALAAALPAVALIGLLGAAASDPALQQALAQLGDTTFAPAAAMAYGRVNLRVERGILLDFSRTAGDGALRLSRISCYRQRVFDARGWPCALPFGLQFNDSQAQVQAKVGRAADERRDFADAGMMRWDFPEYSLQANHSNLDNRLQSVLLLPPRAA